MNLHEYIDTLNAEILGSFGVPASIVGGESGCNYAGHSVAAHQFQQQIQKVAVDLTEEIARVAMWMIFLDEHDRRLTSIAAATATRFPRPDPSPCGCAFAE